MSETIKAPIDGRANVKTTVVPKRAWRELNHTDIGGHRGEKSVVIMRYGAWGDMIMASTLFPQLKEEGWHVTVSTTPRAADAIASDPHVDEFLLQDTGQIPPDELGEYARWLGGAFGRVIHLSESIERGLLAVGPKPYHDKDGALAYTTPDAAFEWEHEKRHALMDRNYIEETHRLAGVPFVRQRTQFYPTVQETRRAAAMVAKWKRRRGADKLIMVVWSGSSCHKRYPWMDSVIASILQNDPKAIFVTAGDEMCRILDDGWQNESRVLRRCGRDSIRHTLTMAQLCDVVVGPETGVLNSVSMSDRVKKVVFLSHSSVENFCKHWRNTTALAGMVDCYPCHKMHYTMETCRRCPMTHGAMCQSTIPFESVVESILGVEQEQKIVNQ